MRHRKSGRKLNRTAEHRKATLANLSAALFERKHIKTTVAKAKETRRVSERLITLAKKESLHARRLALKKLHHKRIVKILFDEIAPQYADRPGGYTRVVKLGQRAGDGAQMAILELVGFEMASKKKKEREKEKEAREGTKKKKRKKEEKAEDVTATAERKKEEKKVEAKAETKIKKVKEEKEATRKKKKKG